MITQLHNYHNQIQNKLNPKKGVGMSVHLCVYLDEWAGVRERGGEKSKIDVHSQ